ncbi:23S rRNA (uracil(1939)-C(5))-methyltransferase [Polynucleobacter sp. QLW-P1DATA-2]|jgi:23S rRNA (uracil1939-C5)-methyltransferase|uniref:23S rRNA (uracil(1939)-C(5))-methyltransferase RlmD n=1 Tax=unclassified Polynucleobacter TaxID=2640945 RepID=UPI0008F9526B|nr:MULTISPECIES: 23S rRNA (uracil(1939)-C(5))-methyltransferase RlmD [unclassified Polynucleobacter]OIM98466.1 23S rRNA (uracil(1939)-C(5))-methyltransferase [Polynucleobacter sp. MWH-Tro8-2-5-gr]OIN00371.1 23S rRNA (uracil(1939)-C(5))-methyltransferase [Polynucleobacter sp. QLW-P1DATA-2]
MRRGDKPVNIEVTEPITVESLDLDAQGIARLAPNEEEAAHGQSGKVVFIKGALPTELVTYTITSDKARFSKAKVREILKPAVFRAQPQCAAFGVCGGCTMQHLDIRAQVAMKQRVLEDDLRHIAKVTPEEILRPMGGPAWEYRHRARLSAVNRSIKKGTVLIGFHEGKSAYVADMLACEILPKHVSNLLPEMRKLVMGLSIVDRMPQIEIAVGEPEEPNSDDLKKAKPVTALVFRNLLPLTTADEQLLRDFADQHQVWIWLQSKGIETVAPFYPETGKLCYRLPEFEIEMPFKPADFTQVNHMMNRTLVSKAIRLLEVKETDRVLDLFCGIGNFTLPLARRAKTVLGIEGLATLTTRAKANAEHNDLASKASFMQSDLFEVTTETIASWGKAERWLMDPPREGAMEICKALADLHIQESPLLPQRIVYVSCNPKTLARDADLLCHQAGYKLKGAGIVNMFPHTSHVESMAVFDRA